MTLFEGFVWVACIVVSPWLTSGSSGVSELRNAHRNHQSHQSIPVEPEKKKAGVAEYPDEVSNHAGLLFDEPPSYAGVLFI
jgi:hypothetical protein